MEVTQDLISSLSENLGIAPNYLADLSLVRTGTNVVFSSKRAKIIVRVPLGAVSIDETQRSIDAALALFELGAPLVPPTLDRPIPLSGGRHASIWPLCEVIRPTPAQIGELLRMTRLVPAISSLKQWNGASKVPERISTAESLGVPEEVVDFLKTEFEQLIDQVREDDGPVVLLHGDSHRSNIVKFAGAVSWIDLDDLACGPPEIDLAPHRVALERFGSSHADWTDLVAAYRHSYEPEALERYARLRQLTMTSWLATLWERRIETREELLHRVSSWSIESRWTEM